MEDCRYVSRLFVYPVKSMGGVEVQQAEVLAKGLAIDRRWMLIDDKQTFITQRTLTKLSRFSISWQPGQDFFTIIHAGQSLQVPVEMPIGNAMQADVWGDIVDVVEVKAAISQWCSQQLGISCKLVAFPEANPRPVDPDYRIDAHNVTSLSDGYPILLIGQSSLDDLNTRLNARVDFDRFRPNIVVQNSTPYEEDGYRQFMIGNVAMAGVKPCARCVMTTIDPQTGEKGKEPLHTLSQYRNKGGKVLFGQNVIPMATGTISVGDVVTLGT